MSEFKIYLNDACYKTPAYTLCSFDMSFGLNFNPKTKYILWSNGNNIYCQSPRGISLRSYSNLYYFSSFSSLMSGCFAGSGYLTVGDPDKTCKTTVNNLIYQFRNIKSYIDLNRFALQNNVEAVILEI